MFTRCAASISILFLAFFAQTARAFIDPPWITPAEPRAGETVSVNIRMGICDVIVSRPGYPQITREGNSIHLLEYGHHWDGGELCIYDIGTLTEPIGAFPPGHYTVTVDFVYDNYPDGYATITLGVIPFAVAGAAAAVPVPTFTPAGLLVLTLVMICLAIETLRTRRRTSWRCFRAYEIDRAIR